MSKDTSRIKEVKTMVYNLGLAGERFNDAMPDYRSASLIGLGNAIKAVESVGGSNFDIRYTGNISTMWIYFDDLESHTIIGWQSDGFYVRDDPGDIFPDRWMSKDELKKQLEAS